MARIPRKLQVRSGYSVHKVWRGHNRESNLGKAEDKSTYIEFMNEDVEKHAENVGAFLQAATLMSNHAHEISYVTDQEQYSEHMRRHHGRYGQYFNRRNDRSGKVAEDRPHTTLLGDAHHEMIAVFYVHANPIRARIVGDPRNYFWCTHVLYAYGVRRQWMKHIVLPKWYLALGPTVELRQRAYRRLFARYLKEEGPGKKNYFQRVFFGPSLWKIALEEEVREWKAQSKRPP